MIDHESRVWEEVDWMPPHRIALFARLILLLRSGPGFGGGPITGVLALCGGNLPPG